MSAPAASPGSPPSLAIVETRRQYVDTIADPSSTETFGAHYLFGHLHRKDAALELRATWSLWAWVL